MMLGPEAPAPAVVTGSMPQGLACLLSAIDEIGALTDPDDVLARTVQLGRRLIGLERTAIFLLDRPRDLMLGTWSSASSGDLVDEHHIAYAPADTDRRAIKRAEKGRAAFTVFDDCPILEHRPDESVVRGRGWVAYTPIRSGRTTIGMFLNDALTSGTPVNATAQAYAAILCARAGALLGPVRGTHGVRVAGTDDTSSRGLAMAATEMIAAEPGIGGKEMAARLGIGANRLTRLFRAEVGMSVVEYRNRLRLDRFNQILQKDRPSLLEAALASGFGSYAQFHRVFRAFRRTTPRAYLDRLA